MRNITTITLEEVKELLDIVVGEYEIVGIEKDYPYNSSVNIKFKTEWCSNGDKDDEVFEIEDYLMLLEDDGFFNYYSSWDMNRLEIRPNNFINLDGVIEMFYKAKGFSDNFNIFKKGCLNCKKYEDLEGLNEFFVIKTNANYCPNCGKSLKKEDNK